MSRTARWLLAPALLAGLLAAAGLASAAVPPVVKDEGKFFSAEALDKANRKIKQIYQRFEKDVVIETFAAIPADLEKKYKEEEKAPFFNEWARKRAEELGVNGIYILVCKKPGRVEVEVGNQTQKKAFTRNDRDSLVRKMLADFKEKKFDEGLLEGVELIESALRKNTGKEAGGGPADRPRG
jgi:uncharacterized protein